MANDFTSDTDLVARWLFAAGALTVDSSGNSNTLSDNGTVQESYWDAAETIECADFEAGSVEYFSISQANLSANFPGKDNTSNRTFTVIGHFMLESQDFYNRGIMGIYDGSGKRVFGIMNRKTTDTYANQLGFIIGHTGGDSYLLATNGTALSTNVRYGYAVAHNGATGAWKIRIWNEDTSVLVGGGNTLGTFTETMNIEASGGPDFRIGLYSSTSDTFDGKMAETVILSRYADDADVDAILEGTYGSTVLPINLPVSWKILAEKSVDTSWKLFDLKDQSTSWKIFKELNRGAAWKILKSSSGDVSWKILSDTTLAAAWKILNSDEKAISYKIINRLKQDSSWAIINRLTRDISWKILLQGILFREISWKILSEKEHQAAWKVLSGQEQQVAWKIFNEIDQNIAWQILASGQISQSLAWKILNSKDQVVGWRIQTATTQETAWKIINEKQQATAWDILKITDQDLAYKIFAELEQDISWSIDSSVLPQALIEFTSQKRNFIFNSAKRTFIFYQKEK